MRTPRYASMLALAAIAALSTVALAGCADGLGGLLGIQSPTAEYRTFAVQDLTLQQVDLDLGYDLGNPNSFALPLVTLDWNLDLFEVPFGFGQMRFEEAPQDAQPTTADGGVLTFLGIESIPAGGSLALNTPFSVALADTFDGVLRVAQGEDVPYLIGGTMHFQTTFGAVDLPFNQTGVWANSELVAFVESIGSDVINDFFN